MYDSLKNFVISSGYSGLFRGKGSILVGNNIGYCEKKIFSGKN